MRYAYIPARDVSRARKFHEGTTPNGTMSDDGIVTAGGARAAWFKGTEGNILAVIQSV